MTRFRDALVQLALTLPTATGFMKWRSRFDKYLKKSTMPAQDYESGPICDRAAAQREVMLGGSRLPPSGRLGQRTALWRPECRTAGGRGLRRRHPPDILGDLGVSLLRSGRARPRAGAAPGVQPKRPRRPWDWFTTAHGGGAGDGSAKQLMGTAARYAPMGIFESSGSQ